MRCARALEVDDFAGESELTEVAAGTLCPSSVADAAGLQRIEARDANQVLDRCRSNVVVGRVEERGTMRFAVRACGQRIRRKRSERLDVVRAGGKQSGDDRPRRLFVGQGSEDLSVPSKPTRFEGSTTTLPSRRCASCGMTSRKSSSHSASTIASTAAVASSTDVARAFGPSSSASAFAFDSSFAASATDSPPAENGRSAHYGTPIGSRSVTSLEVAKRNSRFVRCRPRTTRGDSSSDATQARNADLKGKASARARPR
jgi:hypothetical protein